MYLAGKDRGRRGQNQKLPSITYLQTGQNRRYRWPCSPPFNKNKI